MKFMVTVHLKASYESWKKLFDNDTARADFCDESRTLVGQVGDRTALIALFGVDEQKMNARLSSPEFAEMVKDFVVKHDVYTLTEKASPGA
jgi:hypothetical protein